MVNTEKQVEHVLFYPGYEQERLCQISFALTLPTLILDLIRTGILRISSDSHTSILSFFPKLPSPASLGSSRTQLKEPASTSILFFSLHLKKIGCTFEWIKRLRLKVSPGAVFIVLT